MKIFIIGATGLLGQAGAEELLRRGHTVAGITLPPLPADQKLPKKLKLTLGNYIDMSDAELLRHLKGYDALVFAAGIDERVEGPPPIYNLYKKYNIDALKRLMNLSRKSGIKKVVVLGSYFSHFAKIWPHLELAKHHPYIKSRLDQEEMALAYTKYGMDVSILELPYIFGAQKSRKPVWLFIAEMIRGTKGKTMFYPKGGTTMVTVHQVGQCIAGAVERSTGAMSYPVGWYNMTWKTWLEQFSSDLGMPKKIFTVPNFLFRIAAKKMANDIANKGQESGLKMPDFVDLMTKQAYIDKSIIKNQLGVEPDNINRAIKESAEVCLDILNNPDKQIIDMKPE